MDFLLLGPLVVIGAHGDPVPVELASPPRACWRSCCCMPVSRAATTC